MFGFSLLVQTPLFFAAAAREPEATSLIGTNVYLWGLSFTGLYKMQSIMNAITSKGQGLVVKFVDTTMQRAALPCSPVRIELERSRKIFPRLLSP